MREAMLRQAAMGRRSKIITSVNKFTLSRQFCVRSVRLGVAHPAVQDGGRTHACTTQIEQLVMLGSGPDEQVNVNRKLTVDLCETKNLQQLRRLHLRRREVQSCHLTV